MGTKAVKPEVGAVYELTERDYRFGIGALLVRVTKVNTETVFDNEPWWDVEAIVTALPHAVGPGHERKLYVRAAALRRSRRHN